MRKSQLYSQVFIYILTILIVSLIFIYGYKAINGFKDRANKISCLKFKNDLSNSVKSITGDYGSVVTKSIPLCSGFNEVCFVESHEEFNKQDIPSDLNPVIKDSIRSGSEKNVFLDSARESFNVGPISVEGNVFCIKESDGVIKIRLEGRGNHALVSK